MHNTSDLLRNCRIIQMFAFLLIYHFFQICHIPCKYGKSYQSKIYSNAKVRLKLPAIMFVFKSRLPRGTILFHLKLPACMSLDHFKTKIKFLGFKFLRSQMMDSVHGRSWLHLTRISGNREIEQSKYSYSLARCNVEFQLNALQPNRVSVMLFQWAKQQ